MTSEAKSQEIVTRDQRRAEMSRLEFERGGSMFQPKNGVELMDMANMVSTAGFMVKDIYRGNPGACMGLIAVCAPYGLNPLQVSWKTYKASKGDDAPIAYEAQVIVAMVNASGAVKGGLRYRYEGDGQDRVCIAYGVLVGESETLEVRSPKLSQIGVKNSPLWKSDPDQQLAYYTGRAWVRRYKPEMLLGIYDTDEVASIETGPHTARDITPSEPKLDAFAAIAQRARETAAPQPAQDAQESDKSEAQVDANEERDAHWTDGYDPVNAIPGSKEWDLGEECATNEDRTARACPFEKGSQEGDDWLGGFYGKRRSME